MPLDLLVWGVVNILIAIAIRRFVRRRRARLAREEEARRRHAAWLSEQLARPTQLADNAVTRAHIVNGAVARPTINALRARNGIEPLPEPVRFERYAAGDDYVERDPDLGGVVLGPSLGTDPAPMPTGGGAFGGAGAGGTWEADPETPSVADMAQAIDLVSQAASEPLGMTETPDLGMSEIPTPDADPTCSE